MTTAPAHPHPNPKGQPMTRLITAPWTSEQVQALNDHQERGETSPYICGALHASGRSPVLDATHAGWVCPDPTCDYTQDWAHIPTP